MLNHALELPDVNKIIDFTEMLFGRQLALYAEYKTQFKNIYRERVEEYFTHAPKRTVAVRGEGQIRTQESPTRLQQHQSLPVYAQTDIAHGRRQSGTARQDPH